MDEFLTNLYHEEQEKVAAADLGDFMESVPASELEEFLGLRKTAVAGPAEPPLPTKGGNPEKDQKKVEEEVAKKEAMVRRIEKIARIDWGQAGRATLSNTALGTGLGAGIGALTAKKGKRGKGALRGATIGGAAGLGASAGSILGGGLTHALGNKRAIDHVQKVRDASFAGLVPGALTGGIIARHATMTPEEKDALKKKYSKTKKASMNKEAIIGNALVGGLTGRLTAGGDDETPKSGFWRGAGGGILGGTAGGLLGAPAGIGGMALGSLAGTIGGGYLAGKTARLSPAEKAKYLKERAALAQMGKEGSVAAEKAKVAMRVLRTTKDAPPHIKQAAAQFAGKELAALSR